jgi:LPXTG-motif cell wall-anchored protein
MKIRKKAIGFILTAALIIGSSMSILASPVDDVRAALENAGVPASQTSNAIEYLQKVNITTAQASAVIAKINAIQAVESATGVTDLTKLSAANKTTVENDALAAAAEIGLTASFSKNADGKTIMTIVDSSNNVIASIGSATAASIITNLNATNIAALKNAVTAALTFSNNPDKAKFSAVNGSAMKQTGTNYGNMMVAGVLLVAAAALSFGFKKKTVIA